MYVMVQVCTLFRQFMQAVKTRMLLALQATDKLADGLLHFSSVWPSIKNSPSSGQGLPPSISSSTADLEGRGMYLSPASASLCRPRKPVETSYTMYIHCIYMYIHGSYMYILCT